MTLVVPYSRDLEAAQAAFATRHWPRKKRRWTPGYLRWKFRGTPEDPVDGLLLAAIDGRVVGQLGLIPVSLALDGAAHPAQWACELMVDPEFRRQRIGSLLFEAALSRPMITLGSDPSTLADAAMTSLGFASLWGSRKMILPLRPLHAVRQRMPRRLRLLSPLLATILRPLIVARLLRVRSTSPAHVAAIDTWSAVADRIAPPSAAEPGVLHDASFLSWRCNGYPGFSEALQSARVGRRGFVLFERTAGPLLIHDWGAESLNEAHSLFRTVLDLATASRNHTIEVNVHSEKERSTLFTSSNSRCSLKR